MKILELDAEIRYAVQIDALSRREAARRYQIDPRTVAKMLIGAAGVPAEPAAGASEARPVQRDHRGDPDG